MHVLARAIVDANSLEPEKLRQAILSVKGYAGAEGIYNFDKNGDGLHGYNVVKNNNGAVVFDNRVAYRYLVEGVSWGHPIEVHIRRGLPNPFGPRREWEGSRAHALRSAAPAAPDTGVAAPSIPRCILRVSAAPVMRGRRRGRPAGGATTTSVLPPGLRLRRLRVSGEEYSSQTSRRRCRRSYGQSWLR